MAELRDTEYYYAVKCLKKDVVLEDDDVECTLIERKVLALGTNHPYLCHLFATFQTDVSNLKNYLHRIFLFFLNNNDTSEIEDLVFIVKIAALCGLSNRLTRTVTIFRGL